MTVANLIALLKRMPQESTVVIQNTDGTFQYITTTQQNIVISTRAGESSMGIISQPSDVKIELVVLR